MAIPVAELETMLDALNRAIASSTLMVRHGDTQVMYKSTKDMIAARDDLAAQIARAKGFRRRPRYVTQTRKGY